MRSQTIRAAHVFLASVLAAAPFVVLLALPTFDWGVFRQVETVAVGVHVVAALCALGLLALGMADDAQLSGAATAPVLALVALAAVGAVLAGISDDPARTLSGSLEHGVGVAWFAEAAMVALAASVLRRQAPRAFAVAACAGGASVLACCALEAASIPYQGERLVPYDFREYLGLHALLAAVPLLAMGRRRWDVAAIAVAAVGLAMSGNRGAALAALVAVGVWAWLRTVDGDRLRVRLVAAAVILPLVATLGVWAAKPVLETLATGSAATSPDVASRAPIDHVAIQSKAYGTLWGRSVMAHLAASSMAEHPSRVATGRGFGSFETVAIERSREVPGRRFVVPNETTSLAYWDGDQKARFHSHNLLVEAVLSAGVAGGIAWLAFVAGIGRTASRRTLAAAALLTATLTVAGSLWFLVNSALPLLALAVASLSPAPLARPAAGAARAAGRTLGLGMSMVGFAVLAAVSAAGGKGERLERGYPPLLSNVCTGFEALLMPNRQINTNLYRIFVRTIQDKEEQTARISYLLPRMANAENFSCLMRSYATTNGDVAALETSLRSRIKLDDSLGAGNPVIQAKLGPDFEYWIPDLERFLDLAPGRTELVAEMMLWADARGNAPLVKAVASRLLPRIPDGDPVRPFVLSIKAKAEGDLPAQRKLLSQSLDEGIANVFPLGKSLVTEIRAKEAQAR